MRAERGYTKAGFIPAENEGLVAMELSGTVSMRSPRTAVWAALNDPALLARCIDGAESLQEIAPDRFEGRVVAKVGPVRASFTGVVTIADAVAPERYRLIGEGKGGAAGFAKGEADVSLADEDGGTLVTYTARAAVGGKLAQLGGRLIEGTARGYADRFFAALKAELEGALSEAGDKTPDATAVTSGDNRIAIAAQPADIGPDAAFAQMVEVQPALAASPASAPASGGVPLAVWAAALAVVVLLLLLWLLRG